MQFVICNLQSVFERMILIHKKATNVAFFVGLGQVFKFAMLNHSLKY